MKTWIVKGRRQSSAYADGFISWEIEVEADRLDVIGGALVFIVMDPAYVNKEIVKEVFAVNGYNHCSLKK